QIQLTVLDEALQRVYADALQPLPVAAIPSSFLGQSGRSIPLSDLPSMTAECEYLLEEARALALRTRAGEGRARLRHLFGAAPLYDASYAYELIANLFSRHFDLTVAAPAYERALLEHSDQVAAMLRGSSEALADTPAGLKADQLGFAAHVNAVALVAAA